MLQYIYGNYDEHDEFIDDDEYDDFNDDYDDDEQCFE